MSRLLIALLAATVASAPLHAAAEPAVQEIAKGGKTLLLVRGTYDGMPGQYVIDPKDITGVFTPTNAKGTSLIVLNGFALQVERASAADMRRVLVLVHGEEAVKALGK